MNLGDAVSEGSLLVSVATAGGTGEAPTAGQTPAPEPPPAAAPAPAADVPPAPATASEPVPVTVPDIGDFAGVPVIEILVAVGDEIAVDDPLVTLESDKASMDVPVTRGRPRRRDPREPRRRGLRGQPAPDRRTRRCAAAGAPPAAPPAAVAAAPDAGTPAHAANGDAGRGLGACARDGVGAPTATAGAPVPPSTRARRSAGSRANSACRSPG